LVVAGRSLLVAGRRRSTLIVVSPCLLPYCFFADRCRPVNELVDFYAGRLEYLRESSFTEVVDVYSDFLVV
jgi:hypothetical protein